MSGLSEGNTHASRELNGGMYLKTGDPGLEGGGTYTGTATEGTLQQYENIFGPAGRDIKLDSQRHKRHQRWHLPDNLKGHNQYLTDRIDGLITDATNSPFTKNILPYVYLDNPDQKLKWNVYSFDEGIASRVPYEAAARVLPQTKRSFSGFVVRQGLAIAMEHNFMVSAAGRENFKNQLTQLVGSIQLTNDLDVHVALLQAPSYQKHMNEKYYDNTRTTSQVCRQYIDLFGIMQKIPNALDILIEDAKSNLQTWGSQPPTFCLCNSALTTQLTMLPELTNYVTNGPDGAKRLAQGPNLSSYRGLQIIPSRKFSMDAGTAPRDLLRRRVRVAEYYRIPWSEHNVNRTYDFYDQSRDTLFSLSWADLVQKSKMSDGGDLHDQPGYSIPDAGTGSWSYESLKDQKTPTYQLALWNNTSTRLTAGLILQGRNLPGVELCLQTTGFYYSKNMDHFSRTRRMTIPEILAATPDMRSIFHDQKVVSGLSHYSVKVINNDHPRKVQVSALAEQSEVFGRGLYNDPIQYVQFPQQIADAEPRILTNFDSLLQHGVTRDFEKHWLVNDAFDRLETMFSDSQFGSAALEKCMQDGRACHLAVTPLADLYCLGTLNPLFQSKENCCDLPQKYALKKCRELLDSIFIDLPDPRPRVYVACPPHNITPDFGALCEQEDLLSMDGDMADHYYNDINNDTAITRKEICDLLVRLFKNLCGNTGFDDYMKLPGNNHLIVNTPEGDVTFDLADPAHFTSVITHPNLFFLFLLTPLYDAARFAMINGCMLHMNDVLTDRDKELLNSLSQAGNPGRVNRRGNVFTQMTGCFLAAHYIQEADVNRSVMRYATAAIMRSTNNLLKLYDVPSVNVQAGGNVEPLAANHHVFIDCMATAATAHFIYRSRMQRDARKAAQAHFAKGDLQTLTRKESHRNSALAATCSTAFFRNNVLNLEKNIFDLINGNLNAVYCQEFSRRQFGNNAITENLGGTINEYLLKGYRPSAFVMDVGNPINNQIVVSNLPTPGRPYWRRTYESFVKEMAAGSANVKRTHNIVMQTSRSAGANISHFPNYHLNRCEEMCDADRVRSASSQDEVTWIVQALAGLTPLSQKACRKMMGIQEHVQDFVVQQCAEFFGATNTLNRPTSLGAFAVNGLDPNPLSGHGTFLSNTGTPWAANEYRTNLMLSVMAFFNPSALVRQDASTLSFVPIHIQNEVMLAFAEAIEKNLTHTQRLEDAICELFPDTANHVPFCSEIASSEFTMMPRIYESDQQLATRLTQEVRWDHVPLMQGEGSAPDRESLDDRDTRLLNEMVWDPFQDNYSPYNDRNHDDEGRRTDGMEMHPMRSFSPKSIGMVAGSTKPHTARIHSDLKSAASNAAAFCRDPTNWPVFYKHVLLVWMSRFWQASSRFVDNGSGMMAHYTEPDPLVPQQQVVKYFSNGLHFMHGPKLPTLGTDPNNRTEAVQQCDLVILRPNIEHEMLGIIMGRGGTQELGATFWGQTELSCYDDSQHGIWGMSYKYHERAIVTNERNMIRAYDVAFDGYNGGLDQTCVDWNDSASRKAFRDATYDRSKPYSGPSMLVMALPCSNSRQAWPNPILFHGDMSAGYSPDPEKSQGTLPNMHEHMVFNAVHNPRTCSQATADRWSQYMVRLEMTQWSNAEQSNRPAGESCVLNESTSTPMAFQGSMRVMQGGNLIEDIKGSGHLGHSYVGIASVREGRGMHNPAMQHSTMRLV